MDNMLDKCETLSEDENFNDIHDELSKIARENVDLREYSKEIELKLSKLEDESLASYIESAPKVARLHKQLSDCDSILERMESILTNFHKNLGNISSDIQDLQQRSVLLHQRLQNRQLVRGEISQYLSDIVVPETLIQHILFSEVTDQDFLENLHELDHKIKFVFNKSSFGYASSKDVINILKKLTFKAITRIREFLLTKIAAIRKPLENFHVPQNQMLKFRFYMEFLLTHDRQTANEVKADYLNTMSKIYLSYFKEYISRLSKLQVDLVIDKEDLLGRKLEDITSTNAMATGLPLSSHSTVLRNSVTSISPNRQLGVFSLGDRASTCFLDYSIDSPIMIPHLAAKNDSKYPLEILFRSEQFALFDTACREYFFITDFFLAIPSKDKDSSNQNSTNVLFEEILGKTISFIYKQTEVQIQQASTDVLGLLLCIQIIHGMQRMALKREVPILEIYWANLLGYLWMKVLDRLDQHCGSLHSVDATSLTTLCQSTLPANIFNPEDTEKEASLEFSIPKVAGPELAAAVRNASFIALPPKALPIVRPHPLARRWAEFAAAMHAIGHSSPGTPWMRICQSEVPSVSSPKSKKSTSSKSVTSLSNNSLGEEAMIIPLDGRILIRLSQCQDQFEAALNRLARAFPRLRLRMIFLINNYDLIISVLTEQGCGDSDEVRRCKEAIFIHTRTFIDQALLPFFGSMLTFIKATQQPNKTSTGELVPVGDETRITHIIRGFNIDWRNAIDKIHSEILSEFANFTIATQIFQALLTQLLQYYHDFQSALNEAPYKTMPIRIQLVGVHEIVNEIKKFKFPY